MKIQAELISINQKWVPDSGTQINTVVFMFAGVEAEVEVSEDQVKSLVVALEALRNGRKPRPPATEEDDPEENQEREFGGDFTPTKPMTFQPDESFQVSEVQPMTPREKMRKRAELPPRDPDGFAQG
jgi:hypothetical protein